MRDRPGLQLPVHGDVHLLVEEAHQVLDLGALGDGGAVCTRDEAIAAIVVRTRRYAAYQRKWMRRVPGLVMVDADRPPGEIADDILTLARTRERLPSR